MFFKCLARARINLCAKCPGQRSGKCFLPAGSLFVYISPTARQLAAWIYLDAFRTSYNPDQLSFSECLPASDAGSLRNVPTAHRLTSGHDPSSGLNPFHIRWVGEAQPSHSPKSSRLRRRFTTISPSSGSYSTTRVLRFFSFLRRAISSSSSSSSSSS
jgi:hypothetical protein